MSEGASIAAGADSTTAKVSGVESGAAKATGAKATGVEQAGAPEKAETAHPAKPFKSYLLNKCLIGYGVINGVINGIICYLINMGNPTGTFGFSAILMDFALTGILLGVILMECVLPATRSDIRKNSFVLPDYVDGWQKHLPRGNIAGAVVIGLATMVVSLAIGAVFSLVLPLPLNLMQMVVFKAILCAVIGAFAGYLSIYKVVVHYGK